MVYGTVLSRNRVETEQNASAQTPLKQRRRYTRTRTQLTALKHPATEQVAVDADCNDRGIERGC